MARWVTCDDVFDVLTQGPFPTGESESDAAVELHLTGCHECRQLAEGLRPAVELLQEAMVDGDEDLPAYRGSLPQLSIPPVVAFQYPDPQAPRPSARHSLAHPVSKADPKSIAIAHVARIAAACLLILLMVGTIPWIAALRGRTPAQLRSQLGSAALPDVCRVAFQTPDPTAVSEGCCARCHHPKESGEHPDASSRQVVDPVSNTNYTADVGHVGHAGRTMLLAQNSLQLVAKSCRACHE